MPTRCPVCGAFIGAMDSFCHECEKKLIKYTGSFSIEGASGFTAAYIYDENSSKAVILMKKGICGNADYALGQALADKLRSDGIPVKCDVIIPVPMHRSAKSERGYNQAELISKELSRIFDLPVDSKNVIKSRRTAAQKKLNRIQRQSNLKGAFSIRDDTLIKGKTILLVDDVCTTGSTLRELTALLTEHGAKAVYCAACCKTPPHKRQDAPMQQ